MGRRPAPLTSTKGNDDTRTRILLAALELFSRYGFKRTSVDLLAKEAHVVKPTVYAYFDSKEAIFREVISYVCEQIIASAEQANRAQSSMEERLFGMLSAKFSRVWELVQASPHAQELVDSQGRFGSDIIEQTDAAFLRILTNALQADSSLDWQRIGMTPPTAAKMLIRMSSGAGFDATSLGQYQQHLSEIVHLFVVALGVPSKGIPVWVTES
jgi:AcrR family transcriptional regulator